MNNVPEKQQISIFWFRRDLRLEDNTALREALKDIYSVQPIFIFDENILNELPKDDARLNFIHQSLQSIDQELKKVKKSILCLKGDPLLIWEKLISEFTIKKVFINKDYEPYAKQRDGKITLLLSKYNIQLQSYKDQVIFEENEVLKNDGLPYSIYTPYKNKWLEKFKTIKLQAKTKLNFEKFLKSDYTFPSLKDIGFESSTITIKKYRLDHLKDYVKNRDIPSIDGTSNLSPHLRFGTVSIRQIIIEIGNSNPSFISELIWREFFMQILYHYPRVVNSNFKQKYDGIEWRNNDVEFKKWCEGKTGYPIVDAGMRQLNQTGYMHNRVRMITAGFLCKHLLIDWKWGEAYFAKNLIDYELSSNNGNWQWAAGTGCDAAPYFRIFNPITQLKKFDSNLEYVTHWIPELKSDEYPSPIIEHKLARERALKIYKEGIDVFNFRN